MPARGDETPKARPLKTRAMHSTFHCNARGTAAEPSSLPLEKQLPVFIHLWF